MADIDGTIDLPCHRRVTRAGYVLATSARGATINMKSPPARSATAPRALGRKGGIFVLATKWRAPEDRCMEKHCSEETCQEGAHFRRIGFLVYPDCQSLDLSRPIRNVPLGRPYVERAEKAADLPLRRDRDSRGTCPDDVRIADRRLSQLPRDSRRIGHFGRGRWDGLRSCHRRLLRSWNGCVRSRPGRDESFRFALARSFSRSRPLRSQTRDNALDLCRPSREGVSLDRSRREPHLCPRWECLHIRRDHSRYRPRPGSGGGGSG